MHYHIEIDVPSKRFLIVFILVEIFLNYNKLVMQNPKLKLSPSLPVKEYADKLISNIETILRQNSGHKFPFQFRTYVYDFAMLLIANQKYWPALHLLEASSPSLREDHEFWIFACKYNIAQREKNKEFVASTIICAQEIINGNIQLPEKYVTGVKKCYEELLELQKS